MYQDYLRKVRLSETTMSPVQRIEMRRAFFASAGTLLLYLRDDLGALEEDKGAAELEKLMQEAKTFWNNQKAGDIFNG